MGQSESGIEINCERERQISQKHILFSSSPKANSTKCKTLSLCHNFPTPFLYLPLFHFIFQLHFPISPHFHFHFHFIFQQLLNHSDFLAWLIICVCHRSQRQRSFFSPSYSLSLYLYLKQKAVLYLRSVLVLPAFSYSPAFPLGLRARGKSH